MQILLTGSSGFLGNILKNSLKTQGHNTFDLYNPNEYDNRIDISKAISLNLPSLPEIVIHAAGKAHSVPKTSSDEEAFFQVNYEGTKNLCDAIEGLEKKPKAFIFISTVAVYGLESGVLLNENTPLNGGTPYARSKIQAEEYLINWAALHKITLGILRLPLVAGANPPGNLGMMIKGIKNGGYFSIGKANAKKSIIWAEDITSIIPILAEVGGAYNLTDGYNPSFRELEDKIVLGLNKKSPLKIPNFVASIAAKLGDLLGEKFPINTNKLKKITSTLTFDDDNARKALGWQPTKVLDKIGEIV